MKTKYSSRIILLASLIGLASLLVAWSPPSGPGSSYVNLGAGNSNDDMKGFIAGKNSTVDSGDNHTIVTGNVHNGKSEMSYIGGSYNNFNMKSSIVVGYDNYVGSVASPVLRSLSSAAIGDQNTINAVRGWAIGANNESAGERSVSMGRGTIASNDNSVATGRWNTTMDPTDVFVVGCGASGASRYTALRITDDGGVILGRAQGDISMGAYGN